MDRDDLARRLRRVGMPMVAIALALFLGGVLVSASGVSPFAAADLMMRAGFSCGPAQCNLGSTFALSAPIVLCALGAVVVLRSGLFSIGQEGQYVLGGLAAAVIGAYVELPGGVHAAAALLAAALFGAIWGLLPGLLHVFLGVNELIVSIILNTVAGLLLDFLVNYPLRAEASTVGYSENVHESARLPLFDTATKFGWSFVIAMTLVVAVWFYLSRTTAGYEQRMGGEAAAFARYAGMPGKRAVVRAALVGGALAGVGGGVQVLGVNYNVIEGFSDGTGLTGLTAAILGGTTAIGAGLAGILYAGITVGAVNGLQIGLGVPREIGSTVLALMILLVAVQKPVLTRIDRIIDRRRANRQTDPEVGNGSPATEPEPVSAVPSGGPS